jgi:hypothetical protein
MSDSKIRLILLSDHEMTKNQSGVLTIAVLALLLVAYEFPVLRFHGDARIWGGPGFGYNIKMHDIPVNKLGEYVFHFRGIPNGDMSLQLYAEGKSDQDREELTHLNVTLDAQLVDQNGQVICQGTGMPRDGQNEHIWVVMSGVEAAFWHWNCVHITLTSSASYTLTLRVHDVDPNAPKIILSPVLESDHAVWP